MYTYIEAGALYKKLKFSVKAKSSHKPYRPMKFQHGV